MQNLTIHTAIFGLFFVFFGLMPSTKGIAGNLEPPQQVIQSVSETLQKRLQGKSFTQDFAQVTHFVNDVIEPHTDFDKIAPLVLGKHWKTATTAEQERFKHEFQTLLVRAYSRAFVEYNNWTINYQPVEATDNATKVIVKTKVLQPSIEPVEVNYRMFLSNGEGKSTILLLMA
jgi:phospholipid transport system substrate-binding protein